MIRVFFVLFLFLLCGRRQLGGNVVQDKPEGIVLDVERITAGFQHKVLHKGLWGIVVSLELTEHVDEHAPVEHGLAVHGGHQMGNLLEGEGLDLLHDLGGALHGLALEGHEGLLGVVQGGQIRSGGGVVEQVVVLLGERLPDLFVVRIHF